MKITGINKLRPSAVRRKEAQAAAAGVGFADALREGAGPATTAAAAPVDTVGSLLVLQEVPDAAEGRAKALARGRDLLAELEDIRHGLLIGALSTQRLQGLLGMVHSRRGPDDDPRIRAVLNEIELRARVELAKLGLPA